MPDNSAPPKVAVIGAGYWGRNLVRDFHELGALRLVCDSDPGALAEARAKHPGVLCFSSLDEALSDPVIRGAAVATPAPTHAEVALRCLAAGLDVLVEKPLALTMADGRAIVERAAAGGRILMVDHLLNRHPAFERLKGMARAGELGRVVHVAATRRSFGIIKTAENALWSLAPHDIGLILNLVGRDPLTAQAVGDAWITQGVEDAAFARLVFEGGVVASISASWLHPVKEQSLVVVGQEGMAVFDDAAPWEGKLAVYRHRVEWPGGVPRARRAEAERIPLTPEPPLKRQCQAFLAAVESREGPPDSHGQEALRVLAVLSALSRSLAEGRPVALSEAAGGAMVHPTAVVDPGAVVGDGVRIWHFSHVLPGSVIGEGASLGQNVVVGPNVKVGPGCKIQNNVSVYEGVELEAGVFCGPSMVFTNVHNPRAFIRRMSEARPTLVRRGATIGANATIVCGNELGEHCFIAAGAVVSRPVPAHALMAGVPARRIGWVCRCGVRLPDSLECPACHLRYREEPGGLAEAPGG